MHRHAQPQKNIHTWQCNIFVLTLWIPIPTKKGLCCVPAAFSASHCRKYSTAVSAMTTSGQVVFLGNAQYMGACGASWVGALGQVQPELPPGSEALTLQLRGLSLSTGRLGWKSFPATYKSRHELYQ